MLPVTAMLLELELEELLLMLEEEELLLLDLIEDDELLDKDERLEPTPPVDEDEEEFTQ